MGWSLCQGGNGSTPVYTGATFGDNYSLSNIPASIGSAVVLFYRDGIGLWNGWQDNNHYVLVFPSTSSDVYYDDANGEIVRDADLYYSTIPVGKIAGCKLREQKQTALALTHINNESTRFSIISADISKYMVANTKDILDSNGNVILSANCTLADLGLA